MTLLDGVFFIFWKLNNIKLSANSSIEEIISIIQYTTYIKLNMCMVKFKQKTQ